MKKTVMMGVTASLLAGIAVAAAPVEEAHEYVPAVGQTAVAKTQSTAAKPAAKSGFSLAKLPHESWRNSEDIKADKPVRLALNDELGSARDSTRITMSAEQRLLYVSQQVDNLTKMNLPSELNELQQQVAQLRGQLQDQERTIKTLQSQQESFYENINGKIKQLQDQISSPSTNGSSLNGGVKRNSATAAAMTPTASVAKPVKVSDTQAYQTAFSLLMDKQYAKAKQDFNRYLQDYPEGKYSGNVHYWLGEIALLEKRYPQAEAAFSEVVSRYQHSGKVQDARYKLAVTHLKMGETAKAKNELQLIQKQNAGKTVARLAKLQLQQLS
jgi:tol-pal system protein YbgF